MRNPFEGLLSDHDAAFAGVETRERGLLIPRLRGADDADTVRAAKFEY